MYVKVVLVLLLAAASQAMAALMAIDLGSENMKISIVKPGRIPISIVINEMSKRKTPASVAIVNGDRLVGEEAAALVGRYPEKVFSGFRDLLGKNADDASLLKDTQDLKYPFEVTTAVNRSTVAIKTDQDTVLSVEEAVASLFQYAAGLAQEAAEGVPVTDCVIVVPSYFGPTQRQAIKDAASLANLNVLSLVNSHSAAALQYGIERDFVNKTEQVIFYDLGAKFAEASLVEYSSFLDTYGKAVNQFEVKDVAWVDHNVGGDALEMTLVDLLISKFEGDKSELLNSKRAIAKLKKNSQKAKHVLSANSDVHVSIEDLLPGVDFRAQVTREEFEVAAGEITNRAVMPLKAVMDRNNLTADGLSAIELIGGSSRVPMIKSELSKAVAGRPLDTHLDADEAVVLGAGLVAANLSTIFRLRKFGMIDKSMYEVTFKLGEDDSRVLVPGMKKIPTRRAIKQENITDDFSVALSWTNSHGAGMEQEFSLGKFTVSGISSVVSKRGHSGKVSVHTGVDSSGIFKVDKADASVEIEVEEEVVKPLNVTSSVNSTDNASANVTDASSNNETAVPEIVKEKRKVKRMMKDPLKMEVDLFISGLTSDQMIASRKVLRELRERDRIKRETAKARNDLEGYIINKRGPLEEEESKLYKFSTESERKQILSDFIDAEDWLYGEEAETAKVSTFKSRLSSIRATVDQIEDRIYEASGRDGTNKAIENFVADSLALSKEWAKKKPWITKEETDSATRVLLDLERWARDKMSEQRKKALHEEPAVRIYEMMQKLDEARRSFTRINIKSKPIEKPKVVETPKADETAEKDSADTKTTSPDASDKEAEDATQQADSAQDKKTDQDHSEL